MKEDIIYSVLFWINPKEKQEAIEIGIDELFSFIKIATENGIYNFEINREN